MNHEGSISFIPSSCRNALCSQWLDTAWLGAWEQNQGKKQTACSGARWLLPGNVSTGYLKGIKQLFWRVIAQQQQEGVEKRTSCTVTPSTLAILPFPLASKLRWKKLTKAFCVIFLLIWCSIRMYYLFSRAAFWELNNYGLRRGWWRYSVGLSVTGAWHYLRPTLTLYKPSLQHQYLSISL